MFGTATNFEVGNTPSSIVIDDFNNDGKLDLAVTNQGTNNILILLGEGDDTFGTATNFAVDNSPSSIVIGNFN
jgi:hypothetical protein